MSNNKFSTVTDGDSGCVLLTWPSLRTVHHFPSLHIYFSCYRAVYLVIVALFRLWLTLNWWLDSIALRPIHHSIVNRAEGHSRFFRMLLSCRGHSFYWRLFSLLIPSMGSNLQWRSRRRGAEVSGFLLAFLWENNRRRNSWTISLRWANTALSLHKLASVLNLTKRGKSNNRTGIS